jgi:hypothetical protein
MWTSSTNRKQTRMSRHICTKNLYVAFLQASSVRYSGLALSEVSPKDLSHDSVSRWLKDQNFRPREVWSIAEKHIRKEESCLLICDDTVLAKQRSKKIELVNHQYSGNVHDVIAGIGLVNLLWHGMDSKESVPVDYRIYDKDTDGKTKNTHFCDMLKLAKQRGIKPSAVVMDTWYSSLDNLKAIRSHNWIWVTCLRKNRVVNRNVKLEILDIPEDGLSVHLRGYGWITVFKFVAKNGRIDYVATNMESPTSEHIKSITAARWAVELYHREVKQTCGIERCQVRTSRAQRNHIFLAIVAWFEQHKRRLTEKLTLYQQNWDVIKPSIQKHITLLMHQRKYA